MGIGLDMTNEQILEDAIRATIISNGIEAGLLDINDVYGYGNLATLETLTKFAELTNAKHELQSLKTIADIRDIFNLHKPMMDELPALIKQELTKARANQWQQIESCPSHQDVMFYREDAGVIYGQYTYCAEWVSDEEQALAQYDEETLWKMDFWYFGVDGASRLEGREKPTHWQYLPLPPNAQQERN